MQYIKAFLLLLFIVGMQYNHQMKGMHPQQIPYPAYPVPVAVPNFNFVVDPKPLEIYISPQTIRLSTATTLLVAWLATACYCLYHEKYKQFLGISGCAAIAIGSIKFEII